MNEKEDDKSTLTVKKQIIKVPNPKKYEVVLDEWLTVQVV